MSNKEISSLRILAEYISRDPASWSGISLLYLRLAEKEMDAALAVLTKNRTDILTLKGNHDECVLLGAGLAAERLVGVDIYHWIRNIAANWRQACAIVTAMSVAGKEHETPPLVCDSEKYSVGSSILIVEDDAMTSKMVAHHLQQFGVVTTTKNAREATANNIIHNPDIVFLDIHYKDDIYNGFDVLTNMLSRNPKAFVVMFSANRDPATILKALSLGAQGFIAKPFHAADFSHYLAKFACSK